MLRKRMGHGLLLAVFLAVPALTSPKDGQAYNWSTVIVDAATPSTFASIGVDTAGNPMISYEDRFLDDALNFAICERAASSKGNCDQTGDWKTVKVEDPAEGEAGWQASMALDANGNPVIAYWSTYYGSYSRIDFKFATCDRAASLNGNCDQVADWKTVIIEQPGSDGYQTGIGVDGAGNPMISYSTGHPPMLKFATCSRSASTHGNCDQTGDWKTVMVDPTTDCGGSSLAVTSGGDPMIAYGDQTHGALRFATCDLSASQNRNCDQGSDWKIAVIDSAGGSTGYEPSLAADSNGDPMIVYFDWTSLKKKFATCDRSASAHGNCDQTVDWRLGTVDQAVDQGYNTSIAVDLNGDPMISFNSDDYRVKLAKCDRSASVNGDCDQPADWGTETVDYGRGFTSVTLDAEAHPLVAYSADSSDSLMFATSWLAPAVGGIAELPDVAGASAEHAGAPDGSAWRPGNHAALGGLLAATLVALTAGAWYARRRWLRQRP